MLKIERNWGKIANYSPQCLTKIGTTAFICRSHEGDEYATYNSCRIDISVARGGNSDVNVTRHLQKSEKEQCSRKKKSKDNQFYGKGTRRRAVNVFMPKQNLQCSW